MGMLVEPLAFTLNGAQPISGERENKAVGSGLTQIVLVIVSRPHSKLLAEIILTLYVPAESNLTLIVPVPDVQNEGFRVDVFPREPLVTEYRVPGETGFICQTDFPGIQVPSLELTSCPELPVLVNVNVCPIHIVS